MTPGSLESLSFTLPCATCGACVPFALGHASASLLCPRCGANIHLQDRDTTIQRALLTRGQSARTVRRRLRRLVQL
jgi:DNA-directed RNA polymerase subunit RPC12/RpoP